MVGAGTVAGTVAWRMRRARATERLAEPGPPGEPVPQPPRPTGEGVSVVVNPDAGPALSSDPTDELRAALPDAELVALGEDDDLAELFRSRAEAGAEVLGMAGGDGSVNCAAQVADERDLPLVVAPAGTLNHLARDLGVQSVDDTVRAVQEGRAVRMRLGEIDGRPFLNTASFGGYVKMVDARERYERYLGKWPAAVVALAEVLRTSEPVEVELDGRRRRLWLVFVGNGAYEPKGFVPSRRPRVDDDRLDVRLVDGTSPWSRTKLLVAVLTGRLLHTPTYEEFRTDRLEVRSLEGPLRLAVDGETFDGSERFVACTRADPIVVYTPLGVDEG